LGSGNQIFIASYLEGTDVAIYRYDLLRLICV